MSLIFSKTPELLFEAQQRCFPKQNGGREAGFAAKFGDDVIRDGFPNQYQVVNLSYILPFD
jgi:hypothetical protein